MSVDTVTRSEILRECAREHRGDVPEWLLERYYRHVADEDIVGYGPDRLHGTLLSHKELAQDRAPGTTKVRIFHPTPESDG